MTASELLVLKEKGVLQKALNAPLLEPLELLLELVDKVLFIGHAVGPFLQAVALRCSEVQGDHLRVFLHEGHLRLSIVVVVVGHHMHMEQRKCVFC